MDFFFLPIISSRSISTNVYLVFTLTQSQTSYKIPWVESPSGLCQVTSPSRWVLSLFLNLGSCFLLFSCLLQETVLLKKPSASRVGMRLACRNYSIWPVEQSAVMKWSPFYIRHLQSWIKSGLQQAAIS